MSVDPMLQGLVSGFVREAEGLCQKVTLDLLDLERGGSGAETLQGAYERLARQLHTLKGSASSLGLADVAEVAHRLEDALAPLRRSLQVMPPPVVDGMLAGLDLLLGRVRAHADGQAEALPEIGGLLTSLVVRLGLEPERPTAPADEGRLLFHTTPPILAATPAEFEPAPAAKLDEGWRMSASQVSALLREVDRTRELRMRLEQRQVELTRTAAALLSLPHVTETAEVRSLLSNVTRSLELDADEADDVVAQLEEGIREITTRPFRTLLDPLRRTVRDLCRQLGKEARLSIVGAEVSLDRQVLEKLGGSLLHLVRNAVDHGLELPHLREERGKHREGALTVRVEQQGNLVFVEISDDGCGLDRERIRAKSVERGLYSPADAERLTQQNVDQLIFEPAFTTRDQVTDTSGRGVGLDAVRATLEALQGRIEVQTTPGQGTRFILTLPLELGTSPMVVVRSGEHTFGLPMLAVELMQRVRIAQLHSARERTQVEHNGELISLVDLASRFGLREALQPLEGQPLLVVQSQGRRVALLVDAIVGDRELAVRPLPLELRELPAYQGASTLSSGDLMLVLRPDWLVSAEDSRGVVSAIASRRALVVDDSLTARALHRAMLEAGGFVVHLASSATQALERLAQARYDVVICDLEMEGLSGLELCQALRADPRHASTPIVLVSAHDSEADRQRALAAGADSFLGKRECAAGNLLRVVLSVREQRRIAS